MKYYKSKICYLDNYKNLPIGELGINDIDYVNSEREFVFRKGLLPRSYYEYSTMMPIKDMVGVRYCAYTENHEWVYLLEKALQKEIPVFIDVQEDGEITEEQAKEIIDSFGGEKEYSEELRRILSTSTKSLAVLNIIKKEFKKSLRQRQLKK